MIERFKTGPRMPQAVAAGGTLYLAGQVADDRRVSIEDQTREVLAKIDALPEPVRLSLKRSFDSSL